MSNKNNRTRMKVQLFVFILFFCCLLFSSPPPLLRRKNLLGLEGKIFFCLISELKREEIKKESSVQSNFHSEQLVHVIFKFSSSYLLFYFPLPGPGPSPTVDCKKKKSMSTILEHLRRLITKVTRFSVH